MRTAVSASFAFFSEHYINPISISCYGFCIDAQEELFYTYPIKKATSFYMEFHYNFIYQEKRGFLSLKRMKRAQLLQGIKALVIISLKDNYPPEVIK
jgi:hypothetical protein